MRFGRWFVPLLLLILLGLVRYLPDARLSAVTHLVRTTDPIGERVMAVCGKLTAMASGRDGEDACDLYMDFLAAARTGIVRSDELGELRDACLSALDKLKGALPQSPDLLAELDGLYELVKKSTDAKILQNATLRGELIAVPPDDAIEVDELEGGQYAAP